jgi:hypothetical protein
VGAIESLAAASEENLGDDMGIVPIFLIAAIAGPVSGIITLFVSGWLLTITGRWLGGLADGVSLRSAIAWASVIQLWAALIWIPEIALFGSEMFTTEMPILDANPGYAEVLGALASLRGVLGIWGLVVYLKCIGEVQGFSAWRALGSVLLTTALVIGIAFAVVLPLMLLGLL